MASTSSQTPNTSNTKHPRQPNKAERAKLGKETINILIPRILENSPRAKSGIQNAKQYFSHEIPHAPTISAPSNCNVTIGPALSIHIIQSDTFDAARDIHRAHPTCKVAVLNMCSTLQPGGGVLRGAQAQEESLCTRSTLYPSLRDEYYRMPEDAVIYTPDVLVFRKSDMSMLTKADSFFVDVISCPALRKPQVEKGEYVREKDGEIMQEKVKMIMRLAVHMGVEYLVLGALGCGAYGNPPRIVAETFKRVILGNRKRREIEHWKGIKEIYFAIYGKDENFTIFEQVFGKETAPTIGVLKCVDVRNDSSCQRI